MPDAKDNRKMSGDIRPPTEPAPFAPEELKEANLGADGTPRDRGQARGGREEESRSGSSGDVKSGDEQAQSRQGDRGEGQEGGGR